MVRVIASLMHIGAVAMRPISGANQSPELIASFRSESPRKQVAASYRTLHS
jgi:hypothetical protein